MKTVIITGAARGIGLATTDILHTQGWHVVMVDRDNEELDKQASIRGETTQLCYDISIPNQVNSMIKDVLTIRGQIDALINNAGVADFGPIEETSFTRWRKIMETNLDGVFLCTQAALNSLKLSRGSVVNIASISGLRASTLRVAYGTSKAAVIHLTQQQAAELGEFGIRVNSVSPGPVRTKLAMAVHSQEIINSYHDAIPLNRYGSEAEIGQVIAFLCSDQASFVTGQNISVDGGFESTGIGLPSLREDNHSTE